MELVDVLTYDSFMAGHFCELYPNGKHLRSCGKAGVLLPARVCNLPSLFWCIMAIQICSNDAAPVMLLQYKEASTHQSRIFDEAGAVSDLLAIPRPRRQLNRPTRMLTEIIPE
jgi:hypothetical protein